MKKKAAVLTKKEPIPKPASIRASGFELLTKCRGSLHVNTFGSVYASEGKAFHEALYKRLSNEEVDLNQLGVKYGLDAQSLTDIYWALHKVEFQIPAAATVIVEKELKAKLGEYEVTGHADLIINLGDKSDITDYKFGRSPVAPAEKNGQLMIYALLVFANYPEIETVKVRIIQPRIESITEFEYTREVFFAKYVPTIHEVIKEANTSIEYSIGAHCKDCWGSMDCPAFSGQVKKFAGMVTNKYIKDIDEALKILLPLSKACSSMAFRVEAVAKEWVRKNGTLHISDTAFYALKKATKERLIADKALAILDRFFTKEESNSVLQISKTDVTKLCRSAEKGLSTKVFKALAEGGAIETEEYEKFEYKKTDKEIAE